MTDTRLLCSSSISDKDGPYYWHIKSGTIQREPPEAPLNTKIENRKSLVKDNDSVNDNKLYFIYKLFVLFIFLNLIIIIKIHYRLIIFMDWVI